MERDCSTRESRTDSLAGEVSFDAARPSHVSRRDSGTFAPNGKMFDSEHRYTAVGAGPRPREPSLCQMTARAPPRKGLLKPHSMPLSEWKPGDEMVLTGQVVRVAHLVER